MKIVIFLLRVTLTFAFKITENITELPDLSGVTDLKLEIRKTKINKLEDDAFAAVPQITSLLIVTNPLRSIGKYVFRGLNEIVEVDMTNNALTTMPNFVPICGRLESLTLSLNFLSNIDLTKLSGCTNLTSLNLWKNMITEIPDFSGVNGVSLYQLKYLDLTGNVLTEISEDAFKGLNNLETLRLGENKIKIIENFNLKSVKILILNKNSIVSIPYDLFDGAVLEKFDMSDNEKCEVVPDLNHVRTTLKDLSLFKTNIKKVPFDEKTNMTALIKLNLLTAKLTAFARVTAPNLQELKLDYNKITNISGDDLKGVINLVTITLKNTQISQIPKFPQGMRKLKTLVMSNNQIRTFNAESFEYTPNIEYIDLSDNELEEFPNISSLSSIKQLLVTNNKLKLFSAESVAGLSDCTTLRLGGNLLSVFPNVSLIKNALLNLYINNNPITELDPLMLTGPGADSNKVMTSDLDPGVVLQYLDAQSTSITTISDEFLQAVKNLKTLIVSNSNLTTFPNLTVIRKTLKVVDLSNNDLDRVPTYTLDGMSVLKTLSLNNNHFTTFPFQLLSSMTKLNVLNLSGNKLAGIPILSSYDTRPSTLTLKMTSNPINCDRDLCWLKVENLNKIKVNLSEKPCTTPASLSIEKWTEISYSDLACDSAPPIVTNKFFPIVENGERMWTRTGIIGEEVTSQKARSRSDCGRQCMAKLKTWKLTGCSGFKYVPELDNCILYA